MRLLLTTQKCLVGATRSHHPCAYMHNFTHGRMRLHALGGGILAPADRVAFLFSSTTKTVVLGVPMMRAVYGDRSPG